MNVGHGHALQHKVPFSEGLASLGNYSTLYRTLLTGSVAVMDSLNLVRLPFMDNTTTIMSVTLPRGLLCSLSKLFSF